MVWCPSYPPSVCSVTEGGGVMQRGPIRSLGSVSNTDKQCNPRLFGDGFVLVTLAMEKEWNRGCLHQTKSSGISLRCTCLALPATRCYINSVTLIVSCMGREGRLPSRARLAAEIRDKGKARRCAPDAGAIDALVVLPGDAVQAVRGRVTAARLTCAEAAAGVGSPVTLSKCCSRW
jgi:hypothetical protein